MAVELEEPFCPLWCDIARDKMILALKFGPQTWLRALIVGVLLCIAHFLGVVVGVAAVASFLADPDRPDKPIDHVCTSVVLCPLWVTSSDVTGLTGATTQLAGSVVGLTINLLLLVGVTAGLAWPLLLWLLCYAVAICGCIVLTGIILNTLLVRDSLSHDVHPSTMVLLPMLPATLGLLYAFCWAIIFRLWQDVKRRQALIYLCDQ